MSVVDDRSKNISTNIAVGDVSLGISDSIDPSTTISILALPEIGEIILPGGTVLTVDQILSASELARLVYRPASEGAGNDRFSYRLTDSSSRRTDVDIDVTTTGDVAGTALYFKADTWDFGSELWRVLPTGQVEQVADIHEGSADARPRYMTRLGDSLYFSANTDFDLRSDTGTEPWRVGLDGTAVSLEEINPGSAFGQPSEFTEYGGTLYFSASNVDTGRELYRIAADGNPELVADINTGEFHSRPAQFTVFNGALYFTADTEAQGVELWRYTDTDGVQLVGDLRVGTSSSSPTHLTLFDGALYFSAFGDVGGSQLWRVEGDGLAHQVTDADDIGAHSKPRSLAVFANQLWFQADTPSLGNNYDLYRLGSDDNPVLVENFRIGGLLSEIHWTQVFGDAMYFSIGEKADDGSSLGHELWRVFADDTVELVADINSGASPSNSQQPILFGDAMYFTATDGVHGVEIWRVSAGGEIRRMTDFGTDETHTVTGLHEFDGALYFSANDGIKGSELWQMFPDGTVDLVADINDGAPGSNPSDFQELPIARSVGMPDGSLLDDILHGSDNADTSDGGPGDDQMLGRGGDDFIIGGLGDDTLNGGTGNDTAGFEANIGDSRYPLQKIKKI